MKSTIFSVWKLSNDKWAVIGDVERPDQPGVYDPYYEVETEAKADEIASLCAQGRELEIVW